MFTIAQIYNEDDFINHHGSERRVFNNKISGEIKKENSFVLPPKNLGDIAKFFGKLISRKSSNNKNCLFLETRGLPIFVLIFALSYFFVACLVYSNLF